jgi:hypothetical protein
MHANIVANAELVRKTARDQLGVEVGFDEAGVRWLDGFINRQRLGGTEALKAKLPNTLGSFLGECVRHTYGGEWQQHEAGWVVKVSVRLSVFPFNKVHKQLANEDGDSVLGLFTAIPSLLAGVPQGKAATARPSQERKRPWWRFW